MLQVQLITPDGMVYNDQATAVKVPGVEGSFSVLTKHAPIVSLMTEGKIKITLADQTDQLYFITGGVMEVSQNKVVVLAEQVTRL
jgi:F-type H+-transporting ATPase subunit epsilon